MPVTRTAPCAAAPHSKSGVTVDPKLADKNQQDTLPHVRLMEWVWSYFVDSSSDSDAQHDVGHKVIHPSRYCACSAQQARFWVVSLAGAGG